MLYHIVQKYLLSYNPYVEPDENFSVIPAIYFRWLHHHCVIVSSKKGCVVISPVLLDFFFFQKKNMGNIRQTLNSTDC